MSLGEKIKDCRKKAGLSQEQLAEKLNVSRQAITKWETDKGIPDISNLVAICDEFGLSLDELIKGDTSVIEKIKKKSDTVESNRKLIMFGWIAVILGVILTVIDIIVDSIVIDFIAAAMPWVILGIGIACVATFFAYKKSNN